MEEMIKLAEAFDELLIDNIKQRVIINNAIKWLSENGYYENEYVGEMDNKKWLKANPEELYNILIGGE